MPLTRVAGDSVGAPPRPVEQDPSPSQELEVVAIFAPRSNYVQTKGIQNAYRVLPRIAFVAFIAFCAVFLVANVAASSVGFHPAYAFAAACAFAAYTAIMLWREASR